MKTVQRDAEQLQAGLDEIQAAQMRIDSVLNQVLTAVEFKTTEKFDFVQLGKDLIDINKNLMNVIPVLTGHELPKRG